MTDVSPVPRRFLARVDRLLNAASPRRRVQLIATLAAAKIPVEERADGLHIDLAKTLADGGINVEKAKFDANGLSGSLQIDIDARLRNPNLKDPPPGA